MLEKAQNSLFGGEKASRECPKCHSKEIWKDGKRKNRNGKKQRYICQECNYRFSESAILSTNNNHTFARQICVTSTEGTKNLTKVKTRKINRLAGATKNTRGKIIEYLWYLKKQGYRKSTINSKVKRLERLVRLGANLHDPENVKQIISNDKWKENYKSALVSAYQSFTEMEKITWKPPIYKPVQKLPFIPHENEIDALIAGCGKKVATSLQLLKETGMRIGEAWNLEWIDIDQENQTITCTPEKHGTPRQFKVSPELISMLNQLPKKNDKVFGATSLIAHRHNFTTQRKKIARKLQNPRLKKVSFHSLRHWNATMLYHKTHDILYVKEMLGHRQLNSTLIYTHLVKFESNQYHVKTAKTLEEACELAKAGFTSQKSKTYKFSENQNEPLLRKSTLNS